MNAYEMIKVHYGNRRAKRSNVLLMNHIDEGLEILKMLRADRDVEDAFCLHPLLQADADLKANRHWVATSEVTPRAVLLAMEYRFRANAWLSDKVTVDTEGNIAFQGAPTYGDLPEIKQMLIADKVQNYDDFLLFHARTHARAKELDAYFKEWFKALGVSDEDFRRLADFAKGIS